MRLMLTVALTLAIAFGTGVARPATAAVGGPIESSFQDLPHPGGCWTFVSGNGQLCLISVCDAGLYNVVVVNACGRFWCNGAGTWHRVGDG